MDDELTKVRRDPRYNHELTRDENVKGGKSLSPLKVLANSVRHIKYCSMECPFSDTCPMLPLAMSETIMVGIRKKHPCKLKDAPQAVKRRISNMFLNGEEGLLTEIKTALFVTSTNLGDDNKERMQYTDTLMRFHRSIYGEKGTSINSQEPLEITVRQLHTPSGIGQEVKISNEQKQANALKLLQRKIPPIDIEETDPESLFTSPKLDEIVNGE
jgi:hypothetical protein